MLNTKRCPVITISRQYGSGGRTIGREVAKRLGIPYYDNELIRLAAEESGFSSKLFEDADKNASNSLLFSLSMYGGGNEGNYSMPLGDQVFIIQSDIIKKLAEAGPCVIVGRCAEYILRNRDDCLSVFLHAPIEERIRRVTEDYKVADSKIKDLILKTDKRRAVYYNHFSGNKWGNSENYHLCIDTNPLGIENTVRVICGAVNSLQGK